MSPTNLRQDAVAVAARREAAAVAQSTLDGELGIMEAARELSRLSQWILRDWIADDDFQPIGALDSDSDRFLLGQVRQYWDRAALERLDAERVLIEAAARAEILAACHSIVARFGTSGVGAAEGAGHLPAAG